MNGSIDPGDDYVLDLLAELRLDADPERTDPEALDDPAAVHCGVCDGCRECHGTGLKRAYGRAFTAPDAEAAVAILASVRENHTAQTAGRYTRNPDDYDATATVSVRTDVMPTGFADVQVLGAAWTFGDKQRAVVAEFRAADRPLSARTLARRAGCSKQHVRETLQRLADRPDDGTAHVEAIADAGKQGARLYTADGVLMLVE